MLVERAEFAAARYALGTADDAVLDTWLSDRLNAVPHELLPSGSAVEPGPSARSYPRAGTGAAGWFLTA
jgi:hypothetical protein